MLITRAAAAYRSKKRGRQHNGRQSWTGLQKISFSGRVGRDTEGKQGTRCRGGRRGRRAQGAGKIKCRRASNGAGRRRRHKHAHCARKTKDPMATASERRKCKRGLRVHGLGALARLDALDGISVRLGTEHAAAGHNGVGAHLNHLQDGEGMVDKGGGRASGQVGWVAQKRCTQCVWRSQRGLRAAEHGHACPCGSKSSSLPCPAVAAAARQQLEAATPSCLPHLTHRPTSNGCCTFPEDLPAT